MKTKEYKDQLEAELLRLLIATRAEPGLELARVGKLIREAFDKSEIRALVKKIKL